MAYTQKPGRGNAPKTGHGIPAPFKQMETIKKIGTAINKGGKFLADVAEGRHGSSSYSGGDETMREKNIAKKNPKTTEVKKEVKKVSPAKQMETIKKIGKKIYEGGKYLADAAEGRHGSVNYSESDESMREKNIAKKNPKTNEVKKPDSKKPDSKKPAPAKQLGKQAVTKMGGKKAPAKMKKC